jgi:hypothetical protein
LAQVLFEGFMANMRRSSAICVYVNTVIAVALSLYFFLIPAGELVWDLRDPGLLGRDVPGFAFRWHRALSPKYERWAQDRVRSGKAQSNTSDIAGTEWPLFGSVFYLWATEALQEAVQENPGLCAAPPSQYASGAIEAAAALVADPNHAGWVRQHWGDGYLDHENLFYRMLLISALTSYQKLLGDTRYEDLLRRQAGSLADELDKSSHGLLDDYPGQCYPVDIVPAIAAIQRADAVLGKNHSQFVARAIRGFEGATLDIHTGLPAYVVDSKTGRAEGSARGVGLSFMLIWATRLWTQTAEDWYAKYEQQFWQEGLFFAGFREHPKDINVGWFNMGDVDAGPIVAGYGVAACAFGVGATRAMGDTDHAYKLATQALIASWPLPNGTLLMPRMLSSISDAPYLGEAAMLFALSRRPVAQAQERRKPRLPVIVYLGVLSLLALGIYGVIASVRKLRRWRRNDTANDVPLPQVQALIWSILLGCASAMGVAFGGWFAVIFLLAALILPWQRSRPAEEKEQASSSLLSK